jgi:metal-responsive CopG/Arc/MetJ family transcriptional regulator
MSANSGSLRVSLPKELIEGVDRLVGSRERSKFVREAVEREVKRRRLAAAAAKVGGSLAGVSIPGWETSESAREWVRASRGHTASDSDRLSPDGPEGK